MLSHHIFTTLATVLLSLSQPPPPPPVVDPPRQPGQGPETPRQGFPELALPDPPATRPDDPQPDPEADPDRPNLFVNPSFEDGQDTWFSFAERNPMSWGPFSITDTQARTGTHSALLEMDSAKFKGKTRIHGAIQEIKSTHVPATIGGWYRVENWERGTKKQYLQVVVILWNIKEQIPAVRTTNVQIAYTLAGVEEAPLNISNRRFILSGPAEPVQNEWVHFEIHPRKDFKEQWGIDFQGFEYARVLFEVRYDGQAEGEPPSRANVWYDDVYAWE